MHELVSSSPAEAAALGTSCAVLAMVLAVGAYLHWRAIQRAMRRGSPLPRPILVPVVVVGVGVVAALVGVSAALP